MKWVCNENVGSLNYEEPQTFALNFYGVYYIIVKVQGESRTRFP